MSLLTETLECIARSGHTTTDIVFIGSLESGHCCSWEEYEILAQVEYDSGFGAAQVAQDLKIVFADEQTMWRGEYDGSEWWEFSTPAVVPEEQKTINNLFAGPATVGWVSLEEIDMSTDAEGGAK